MQDPTRYYHAQAGRWEMEVLKRRKRRDGVTVLRVAVFLALMLGIYAMVAFRPMGLWIGVEAGLLIGFIGLGIADRKAVNRIRAAEESLACCDQELRYLDGNMEGLDQGEDFYNGSGGHAYARDLDIFGEDSLFGRINRTVTYGGRELMADWLLNPCQDSREIRARQEAVDELAAKPDWRLSFRVAGAWRKAGKTAPDGGREWLAEKPIFGSGNWQVLLPGMNVGMGVLLVLAITGVLSWHVPALFFLLQLLVVGAYLKRINKLHGDVDRFVKVLGGYSRMVGLLYGEKFGSERIEGLKARLFGGEHNALSGFKRLVRILNDLDQRGNLLVALLFNGLYMRDIYVARSLERWKLKCGEYVPGWIEAVEQADVLVSMGNYRFNHPDYVVPEITEEVLLEGIGMGHPALGREEMVVNDFGVEKLHELYIVTGANMAGKSTFLRTVGVNLVLALSGNVVCAGRMRCAVMGLFTSMRTTDNLSKGTSYFHAELLRLQELIRTAEQGGKVFIILDEMLKGTNSTDKLNGSLQFLEKLLQYPVAGLVATHDLGLGELAERFEGNFRNVCFEIGHTEDDIVYDYKLKPGVSRNMNASILLEKMGLI